MFNTAHACHVKKKKKDKVSTLQIVDIIRFSKSNKWSKEKTRPIGKPSCSLPSLTEENTIFVRIYSDINNKSNIVRNLHEVPPNQNEYL